MMFRKSYLMFLTLAGLLLLSSTSLFAQGSPIKGKVELKKADGTVTPIEGATVTLYRTDAKMDKLASVKTDAQGMYASEAVAADQNFVVVVSAPNALAAVAGGKGGATVNVSLTPGDGSVPSDEEVRDVIKMSTVDPNSAEGQKLKAEREKKIAELNAKNEKAKASNEVINRTIKEGQTIFKAADEAYKAKNYDVAITKFAEAAAKFDEGYNAAPDFIGSAPVMLNNKGNSLRLRGFNNYLKSRTSGADKASLMEAAKKDFNDAITAHQQALTLLATAPATDKAAQDNKLFVLSGMTEDYRLLVGTGADSTKTKELSAAADQYIAAETNAEVKAAKINELANTFLNAGDTANAIPFYKKVLEADPKNLDAMGNLGLSLYSEGANKNDKNLKQEGLDLMSQFVEMAPNTNPKKAEIKAVVDDLITREKMTPQKGGKKKT